MRESEATGMTRRRRAVALLVLASVLGGLAASDVARREAALRAQLGPAVPAVVARADLVAGRRLEAGDLAVRRVPERYAPVGAADAPETLIGRRLGAAVPSGGYVGASQLELRGTSAAATVGPGERAVEVVGLGARSLVVPGARVDVLVTRDADGSAAAGTQLALEDVEVLAARAAPSAARAAGGERGPRPRGGGPGRPPPRRRGARRRDAASVGPAGRLPRGRPVLRPRGAAAAARGRRPRPCRPGRRRARVALRSRAVTASADSAG